MPMTRGASATVKIYDEAWARIDSESRLANLRSIWADDGLYVDPDAPEGVRGPDARLADVLASLDEPR
jgi:hypothetical protein